MGDLFTEALSGVTHQQEEDQLQGTDRQTQALLGLVGWGGVGTARQEGEIGRTTRSRVGDTFFCFTLPYIM